MNVPNDGGQNDEKAYTFNDLVPPILETICENVSNHDLVNVYDVNVALRAASIQSAMRRRVKLNMGPFDHSETMTYFHSPFFEKFAPYVQFLELTSTSKMLNNDWPCPLIERCINLRTVAINGNGYIMQPDRIITAVRGTVQNLKLKGFFMFPSFVLYTTHMPNLRILILDSIQNILNEDLTLFLTTNPNIIEISLRNMEFDVMALNFLTHTKKIHLATMINFHDFDFASLAALPDLVDFKITGLKGITRNQIIQFGQLNNLENLEIAVFVTEPLAVTVPSQIIEMISSMVELKRFVFSTNVSIESSIIESYEFISSYFRILNDITVIFKTHGAHYVFTSNKISKNGSDLVLRDQFFMVNPPKKVIMAEPTMPEHISITKIRDLKTIQNKDTSKVQRITINLSKRLLSREVVDIFDKSCELFGGTIKELTLIGIRSGCFFIFLLC